jgi:aminopeptidase N
MRNALLILGLAAAVAAAGPELSGKPGVRPSTGINADSVHSFDVRQYRVDLSLPMTDKSYSAHAFISFASRVPSLAVCSLDFVSLVCDSVKRTGITQAFDTTAGRLLVSLSPPVAQGESSVVEVFFRRLATAADRGYYFAAPPTVTYAYCMTCTPPEDARYWMPCYDAPRDKPERGVCLNLTVPDTFQTCANGLCDSVTSGAGTRTWWWRHSYPIATYLIVFSASRYASWSDTAVSVTGDTVPLLYFMWPGDSAVSRTTFYNVPDMATYYSDTALFGPYPFEKYGMVPGYYAFPWGGMENQTLTMIHTQWLRQGDNTGMAHELSHSWWGDMVTCVDFRDVWLNEGFGTYSECLYLGHAGGHATFLSAMRARASSAISQDRSRRFAIFDPPPADIYNYGTIYCKGAWVEHMLRFVEGDTAFGQPGVFFRALRAYGDSFRYGTASTEDYRRINEQVTGLDLGWFFDEWVYQAGIPRYALHWAGEPAGDSWRVVATLTQNNGSNAPAVFHMPLPVRLNCSGDSVLVTLRPDASPFTDTFSVAHEPRSVTVDPDNWVLDSTAVTGIAEGRMTPDAARFTPTATITRGTLVLPSAICHLQSAIVLLDPAGRCVLVLHAGPNDVSALAPGVYFIRTNAALTKTVLLP